MLVGHLAVGLVAKRIEPKISLGTWILAALLSDLLVFPLLIAGIEHFDVVPGATVNRAVGRDIVYRRILAAGSYPLCSRDTPNQARRQLRILDRRCAAHARVVRKH